MSSYEKLFTKLQLNGLNSTKDWSAAVDFLALLVEYCLDTKPSTIVECSSGVSTIVLARCCEINQQGKVLSLENGEDYANNTRRQLKHFKLSDYADVLDTPLIDMTINDRSYSWYQADKLIVENIDLLVIDGPPGFIQKESRFPALPMLHSSFAQKCRVYLDDAAREDEIKIVKRWLKLYSPYRNKYIETKRGCAILDFE